MSSGPEVCVSCEVERGRVTPPGGILLRTERWSLNHRITHADEEWDGWFVLQPRRHVTSIADLDPVEQRELGALLGHVEQGLLGDLAACRLYVASLGTRCDDHLHFHLIPVSEDIESQSLPGLAAFTDGPPGLDRDLILRRLEVERWAATRPNTTGPLTGMAGVVDRSVNAIRQRSPYVLLLGLFNRRSAGRIERAHVAEFYTIGWLAILALALGIVWRGDPPRGVLVAACAIAAVRLIDILATQTGIILFESQSSNFLGVRSIARTVILGLLNIAESLTALAIFSSAAERWSTRSDAFTPVLAGPVEAILVSAGPLAAAPSTPHTGAALLVGVLTLAVMGTLTLLVLGVFVSNLSARLSGRGSE